ncbi:ataxin-2-like protein isoform X7 [Psammomys obesus]|uniref:ataxin-2-like protein isoform X7 n=1 Tax=Psammomys obesus TaxID=48139 RepID=UPI0024535A82|nr:ataxin-2-like protein isoform X7 [Psammomys obesus]
MLKPQPPQQTSQPQQPPPTPQAVARRPPGGTSPPNGGLPGPLPATAAPPGPPAAVSPCLGPAAVAGSGLRRGPESILAAPPPPPQHQERPGAVAIGSVRGQSTGKGPPQSPVFEGVYNNSRMLHFLTAVVGSTCDVKVKNGTTYEGIFKTLSSKFELAVDAVHRKASEPAGGPRREDIVDTMVFKPSDVLLVHFRNVDFNYATKDKFTDSAIAMNSKVNGEHKEKKRTIQKSLGSGSCVQPSWLERLSQVPSTAYGLPWKMMMGERRRRSTAQFSAKGLGGRAPAWCPGRGSISLCLNEFGKVPGEEFDAVVLEEDGLALALCHLGALTILTTAALALGLRHVVLMEAQRPLRGAKTLSSPNNRPSGEASVPPTPAAGRVYPPRSPKSAAPAPVSASCPEPPIGSAVASSASIPVTTSLVDPGVGSVSPASPKISLAPTDVKELPTKEPSRTLEAQELARIAGKVPGLQNEQKRFQLEELRKFGAQFKLQPSSSPETSLDPFPSRILKEEVKGKEKEVDGLLTSDPMGSPVSAKTESILDKEDKPPLAAVGATEGPEQLPPPCPSQTGSPPVGLIKGDDKEEGPVTEQVKKSTLNPNAKEFNPTKPLLSVNKSTSTPTSPGPRTHSTPSIPVLTAGQSGLYSPQYISYIPQIHMGPAVQAPQMYPYPVSNSVPGQQGKYRGAKGSLPPQRSDQHQPASAPPMMQAAAAAAGPPLVAATPYSSYIPYNPQQFPGQPAMMQPMAHYPSQPVFAPMLQSNPRMLTSGSHPQAIVSSSTPQYPSAEQPTPQALYATVHQSYPHHATQLHGHQPQPATTPTGSQPQSQHAAPSPVQHQAGQAPHLGSGQPQQNLYHPGALTGTPPSLPPGPSAQSPQSSFPQPAAVYAIHPHQQLPHGFTNMAHVTQAHVQTGVTAAPPPHPGAPHPPQVMLLHPPQGHGGPPQGAVPPSGVPALSASTPSPYPYIGHPQGEQPGQAPGFPGGADDRIREFSLAGGIWHGRAEGLQVGQDARVLGGD